MTTTAHPIARAASTAFRHFQRGVSLLEVLIAVLVLSFGLLGLAGLQLSSLRNSQSSFERSNAVMQIYSITDVMRADLPTAESGGYNLALGGSPSGSGFAANQLSAWLDRLEETLGEGTEGGIACINTALPASSISTVCTITIRWDDSLGSGGSETQTLTTEVQL